ncbi:hypothetical protein BGZ83_009794 [Gryganskiella cystojenkinii]|nr:hypothetical protein BGZ83_009794 [Gryganskiella cystojenkinii]
MTQRALYLPEVLFVLGAYLDATQVTQCAMVCRVWYYAFAPLVWEDLHFHTDPQEKNLHPLHSSIRARYISFSRFVTPTNPAITATTTTEPLPLHGPTLEETTLSEFLQSKAGWFRSLCYHGHGSTLQFTLGKDCTKLESLSIKGPIPYIGNEATGNRLHETAITRAIRIHGEGGGPYLREYHDKCKSLLRQNREHLQHLTIRDFDWHVGERLRPGLPNWNPLISCASGLHHLRSLTLIRCSMRGRHVKALWAIGSTLESLTLEEVYMNIGHWINRRNLIESQVNSSQEQGAKEQALDLDDDYVDNTGDVFFKSRVFPKLQELTMCNMGATSGKSKQLIKYFLEECPRLRTLTWRRDKYGKEFGQETFCTALEEGFWPELDSIEIRDVNWTTKSSLASILKTYRQPQAQSSTPSSTPSASSPCLPPSPPSPPSTPQPQQNSIPVESKTKLVRKSLSRLHLTILQMAPDAYNLFRHHFATLRHVNLNLFHTNTRAWVIEVLGSCPLLEVLQSNMMRITDFVEYPLEVPLETTKTDQETVREPTAIDGRSAPKWRTPWVCRNLQELHMTVDMGINELSFDPNALAPPNRPYSSQEAHLASLFFQQLGQMTRLRVLNMSEYREVAPPEKPFKYTSVLPFQLCTGLEHLRPLKSLATVKWIGHQDLRLRDIHWMLDHWSGLQEIGGCLLNTRVDPELVGSDAKLLCIFDLEFTRVIEERGVKRLPWMNIYGSAKTCSADRLCDLDPECVARWKERMLAEAEEYEIMSRLERL